MRKCRICGVKVKAKNLCGKHYAQQWKSKLPKYPRNKGRYKNSIMKCRVENCNLPAKNWGVCWKHYDRWRKYRDFNMMKSMLKGNLNSNWKGGISDYPNHHLMKKNRQLKIIQIKGQCEKCGNSGKQIHHLDNKKDNHELNNLMFLCFKCHAKIHRGRTNKNSKFIRLYGMTLDTIANQSKISRNKAYLLHKEGLLKNKLLTIY